MLLLLHMLNSSPLTERAKTLLNEIKASETCVSAELRDIWTLIKFYRYENRQCQNKIKMPQKKIGYRYRKK